MRLGVTYYPKVRSEFKKIEKYVDMIETDNLDVVYEISKPWTFHFRRSLDGKSINLLNSDSISQTLSSGYVKQILEEKRPEIISLHLGFSAEPDNHNYAITDVMDRTQVRERFLKSLNYVTDLLSIPTAVENLDYHEGGAYEYVCEPRFIKSLLDENDKLCLLLDIAHAEISAVKQLHEDPKYRLEATREYLNELPLDKVIEIHINAPTWKDNIALDMHLPMTDVELSLLKELLDLPNLDVVNLECEERVSEQLRELYQLIKK